MAEENSPAYGNFVVRIRREDGWYPIVPVFNGTNYGVVKKPTIDSERAADEFFMNATGNWSDSTMYWKEV